MVDTEYLINDVLDDEMGDEEWLRQIKDDWDAITPVKRHNLEDRMDKDSSPNSILGRRAAMKKALEQKQLNKTLCAQCRDWHDVAEYRKKGSMTYVRLCLKCAKKQKAALMYSPYSRLAKE